MIRHCIALVVPAGLLLTVIARVAVGRVFGGGFADVWVLVGLLVPSFLALSITEVLVGFLVVRLERTREFLLMSSAASAGNLVGAAGLVTLLGVAGAAISSSIFSTLSALYLLVRLVRAGGPTNPLAYLPGRAELQDYRRLLGAARPQRLRPSGGHR
jgi:O-antigen/teichoic acid export membrane protein